MKRILLITLLVAAVAAGALSLMIPGGRAQVQVTVEPSMTKGAPDASVTIVEFSDYQ